LSKILINSYPGADFCRGAECVHRINL